MTAAPTTTPPAERLERRGHTAESRPQAVERLVRETHGVLGRFGVDWSQSKVSRLVRQYVHQVAPNGVQLGQFLLNKITLDVQRKAEIAASLDALKPVYADPTGETAARNVDRERTGGRHG